MDDQWTDQQAAEMAADRGRLIRDLAAQRQAAGLSQTQVAALMGTSQSAVARLESGTTDVRASTLERYAAAVGSKIKENPMPETISAHIPRMPPGPAEPFHPGRQPGTPPGGPLRDPLSPTRVWADPHADWEARLYEGLLAKRIVLASGILDDAAAARLSAQLLTLDAEGNQPIRLELQNLHAELSAVITVMGILDVLRAPVHGCVSGEIAGPALGLLAGCTRRTGYPNAIVTLAEPKAHLSGTATAISAREQQLVRMLDTVYFKLADVTGRPVEDIRDDARQGRVLTTAQAIGYGLLEAQEAPR